MEIRRIRPDEWAGLRSLRLAALQDAPDAFGSTYEEEANEPTRTWKRWARSGADGGPSFVAIAVAQTGEPCGLAVGAPHEDLEDADGLFAMWVDPHHRRLGLGRDLVGSVVRWASSTDRARLVLRVTESNAAAVSLYRSCGFVPTDERAPLRPGSPIVTVVMEHRR